MPHFQPHTFIQAFGAASAILFLAGPGRTAAPAGVNLALNRAAYHSSARDYNNTAHLATDGSLDTRWESGAGDTQWIYVDLGETCPVNRVRLQWGDSYARSFKLQVSQEAVRPAHWTDVYTTTDGTGGIQDIPLAPTRARFVRLYSTRGSAPEGLSLAEFEVYGTRPTPPAVRPAPRLQPDGRLLLNGADWRVRSASFVTAAPAILSQPDLDVSGWIRATVPGTVLTSYLNAGAVPDPFYADQQFQISDSFFSTNDFWYRTSFSAPASYAGRHTWLHFDGINWKADIYLNGAPVGHIDGAFIRSNFDVTALMRPGQVSTLAVLIHKVEHPGPMNLKSLTHISRNGGILGLDSPTFVSSIGWNWLPTIRDRNIGIWNNVYLDSTGDVTVEDPFVTTDLPDVSRADLSIRVGIRNHAATPLEGALEGTIGTITFRQPVTLEGSEFKQVTLDKTQFPQLVLANPRLWWPNGYGGQPLYHLNLRFVVKGAASDSKSVTFGVRKMGYDTSGGILKILVNGRRILIRGGNWGMDEGMLRCDAQGYDTRVRLHHEMNFNMIRNWVGMTDRDEFYDACDRYGILIWDDFWLANPGDGPNPSDHALFLTNARDRILRTRSHPSLALYCGRNEGRPPADIDAALRQATEELDGSRHYISDSAAGVVSGHGPYEVQDPAWYYQNRGKTLHSELGIVCVPPVESMREMLPADKLWPINDLWGLHDLSAARGPLYVARVNKRYGTTTSVEDFCRKAQMVNLETARAMCEAWQSKQGSGVLVWMTQAAWPSLICQVYDYYFEPTGAYFGCKKGCEPVHILWDQSTEEVKVANNTPGDLAGLTAEAAVYNLDGSLKWSKKAVMGLPSTSGATCFPLEKPADLSTVYFVKLKLSKGATLLSDNFYWASEPGETCQALEGLAKVTLASSARQSTAAGQRTLTATIRNPSTSVALAIHLKTVGATSGRRILPAYYNDNYFSLLPGEAKTVQVEFDQKILQGETPRLLLEGWNIEPAEVPIR